ncbi:MAG: hypothetical protein JHC21_01315 [Thermocrinis sp.]|nr:hypothetical protein [Thermocrinis sp.]MCI4458242.1 hypothetical protein [Thermocrinis sp.]
MPKKEEGKVLIIGDKADIIIADSPEGWSVLFSEDMLKDKKIFRGPIRLLLYAMSLAYHDTLEVVISPDRAVKDLGITRRTFYRWLKVLMSKGLLTRIANNVYRLNLVKDA